MTQNKKNQPQREAPKDKDLAYYLTLFKIEGHTTWRAHLAQDKEAFEKQKQPTWPKVTELVVMRIDRLTDTFKPQ